MSSSYRGDAHSRILYQNLTPMYVTKIMRFDWSAVFEKNFHQIEPCSIRCKFLVHVS